MAVGGKRWGIWPPILLSLIPSTLVEEVAPVVSASSGVMAAAIHQTLPTSNKGSLCLS